MWIQYPQQTLTLFKQHLHSRFTTPCHQAEFCLCRRVDFSHGARQPSLAETSLVPSSSPSCAQLPDQPPVAEATPEGNAFGWRCCRCSCGKCELVVVMPKVSVDMGLGWLKSFEHPNKPRRYEAVT